MLTLPMRIEISLGAARNLPHSRAIPEIECAAEYQSESVDGEMFVLSGEQLKCRTYMK